MVDSMKERAKQLVSQMTLEEKVYQMMNSAPAIKRLNIKAYNWWNEGLHGVARAGIATIFPQAIGLAAAFDEDMMEMVGDAIATEARAKFNLQQEMEDTDIYKGLTMWAPNINIFRDPRWGRGHETYGEDPYLTSRLGVRFIEGLQGHDEKYMKVAACAKHFAVHSGPEDIRHSFNAVVSKQDLNETYLPAFKACVKEAKVETVMGAYNRTNGEPCCGSKLLLVDTLRNKWKFEGHVVSDCWAISDFHEGHMITNSPVESVSLAVNQGCDLNCGSLFTYLIQAVEENKVSEARIDEAVTRLFTTRMKLGLLEESGKFPFENLTYDLVDSVKMRELNLSVAQKCIVLLKNENHILPLNKKKLKTIGVIGPNADNRRALVGNYEGTASRYVTILEGIQDYLKDEVRVIASEGCHLYKDRMTTLAIENDRISEVKGVCKESDVVIACLGLDASLEGEEGDTSNQYASGDKRDLDLPGIQQEVLQTIYESGKPVILILLSGSALAVNWADEHVPAIIQGWYPGAQGGTAIARILLGDASPEGKLPITFYHTIEELPPFTDYNMKDRTYRYMKQESLYPFGYGLSYADIDITQCNISNSEITSDGINVSVRMQNHSDIPAGETVQVYVKYENPESPNPQLKALKKLYLQPKEAKKVTLHLGLEAFSLFDKQGVQKVSKGSYSIFVGMSQPDLRSIELMNKKPEQFLVCANEEYVIE